MGCGIGVSDKINNQPVQVLKAAIKAGAFILVVAKSGQMLASCLHTHGYQVLMIDCFADKDTRSLSCDYVQLDSLNLESVSQAFFKLSQHYAIDYIIYGSGLDSYPDSLKFLQTQSPVLLANPQDVILSLHNKDSFFTTLQSLHIPFPDISFSPPGDDYKHWLIKPWYTEGGGVGIKPYQPPSTDYCQCYWQKYIDGIPLSVSFVANKKKYEIQGFNRQLFEPQGCYPFVFTGIISQPDIPTEQVRKITQWLDKLVPTFELNGLNTIDFILFGTDCYLLEINPRPSASLPLYHNNGIQAHISSFLTGDWQTLPRLTECRGIKIVYASKTVQIKNSLSMIDWVRDIPQPGTLIYTGQPICSIIARGNNQRQVFYDLLIKQQQIKQQLE